jgi:hypothetical protein
MELTLTRQPSGEAALLLRLPATREFEGARRLGLRVPSLLLAAATLLPAQAATLRDRPGCVLRLPPSTPLPALPGIPSTMTSSSRALWGVR